MLIMFTASTLCLMMVILYGRVRHHRQSKTMTDQYHIAQSEIQQLRAHVSALQTKIQQMHNDPVTGLIGWELFTDRVNQVIKESQRYQFTMSLMLVDIDNFKMLNEALGYEAGNLLLQEATKRLNQCIRHADTVTRFANDTFVVLLSQLTRPETVAIVGQRILQAFSLPFQIKERDMSITIGMGAALYPTDGQDVSTLMNHANHALEAAKKTGKHLCQFYQENMHLRSQRELAIYNSLSRESIFEEFVVYFQPIVQVETQQVLCMEASLSWQHAEVGTITSQELVDYAEKKHQLDSLSMWLLKNACQQFLTWQKYDFKPRFLSIPLALDQLANKNFVYQLSHVLQQLEFNPESLLIGIKEDFKHASLDTLKEALGMLNYIGVKIVIKDFGSGLFPFQYLKTIPIDYLQLDPSLTDDIIDHQQAQALLKAVIFLADSLSLQVIAQHVVTQQQVEWLQQLGCHYLQGPLFGMPASADVIKTMTAPATNSMI